MRYLIVGRNRSVAVEGDRIVAAEDGFDTVLSLPGADLLPGLINAHDHLHRNHYGRLGAGPYPNAYSWAHDIQSRHGDAIALGRALPRHEALLAGAWKNLLCGVTSVVHHDRWEPDFDDHFPLRVLRVQSADSLGMSGEVAHLAGRRFCLHVAEGIDERASGEVGRLAALGLLTADLIAVHGVGMDEGATARFRASGAALAWCPSSNLFLFGRTAPAALLAEPLDVMLGSDSLLTGVGDLLDELALARRLGYLSDARLMDAVGATAARRLGLPAPSLEIGARADIVAIECPLLDARARDVALVVAGGVPRVARPDLADRLNRLAPGGALMRVGPLARWTNGHAHRAAREGLGNESMGGANRP